MSKYLPDIPKNNGWVFPYLSLTHSCVCVGVGSRVISSLCCGSVWFHAFDPREASWSGGEGNRCEAGRLVAVQMVLARGCCCLLMLASNTHTHIHTRSAYRSPNPHLRPPYIMFAFNQGTLITCSVHWSPVRISCWQETCAKTLIRWWPIHSGECHSYSSYCWSLPSIFWITQI